MESTLREMIELLSRTNEPDWARCLERLLVRAQAPGDGDPQTLARDVLALFGGMGSFSDLVLSVGGVPLRAENDRLAALRTKLHAEAVALLTTH